MNMSHNRNKKKFTRSEEGTLTVSSSGEIKIKLDFVPTSVEVDFTDVEPVHGACDHHHHDKIEVIFDTRTEFDIIWKIRETRHIKWTAKAKK
jgi:hypothetical protein